MRTVRSSSRLLGGGMSVGGVSAQGVSTRGVSACHTYRLWTEWQTRVKTLPGCNYVADGNYLGSACSLTGNRSSFSAFDLWVCKAVVSTILNSQQFKTSFKLLNKLIFKFQIIQNHCLINTTINHFLIWQYVIFRIITVVTNIKFSVVFSNLYCSFS